MRGFKLFLTTTFIPLCIGYCFGHSYEWGENSVLENQIIYSDNNGIIYSEYNNKVYEYYYENENSIKLSKIQNLIIEDDILLNENGYIIYRGKSKNIPMELLEKEVIEIESCDDRQYTTTIFIR